MLCILHTCAHPSMHAVHMNSRKGAFYQLFGVQASALWMWRILRSLASDRPVVISVLHKFSGCFQKIYHILLLYHFHHHLFYQGFSRLLKNVSQKGTLLNADECRTLRQKRSACAKKQRCSLGELGTRSVERSLVQIPGLDAFTGSCEGHRWPQLMVLGHLKVWKNASFMNCTWAIQESLNGKHH